MRLQWAASLPLQLATRARRSRAADWPGLERTTVSVGNLALGGRGKTPTAAALARAAALRVAKRGDAGRVGCATRATRGSGR